MKRTRNRRAVLLVAVSMVGALTVSSARALVASGGPDGIVQQLMASAVEWNRGNLEGFIAPYAPDSTFMTPAGPIGRAQMEVRYREKSLPAAARCRRCGSRKSRRGCSGRITR